MVEWAGALLLVAVIIAAVIASGWGSAVAQAFGCSVQGVFRAPCSPTASDTVKGQKIPFLPSRDAYTYDYSIPGATPSMSSADVASFVTSHFSDVFPFGGCGEQIHVGDACVLQFAGQSAPVRVVSIGPTSFTFESMPGHPEGPYRFITFSFATDGNGQSQMTVHAEGPATLGSEATIHTGLGWSFWEGFALKLGWVLSHQ